MGIAVAGLAVAGLAIAGIGLDLGGKKPWQQKWRQELVDLLDAQPAAPPVPAKVGKAIQRVLAKAPPDDSSAIRSLRNELSRLNVSYKPQYVTALRLRAFEAFDETDEEEAILLLLH